MMRLVLGHNKHPEPIFLKLMTLPSKGVPERQRGWGMLVRLLGNLFVNPINIPLRRFAYAARRCPPSKGEWLTLTLIPDYFVKEL